MLHMLLHKLFFRCLGQSNFQKSGRSRRQSTRWGRYEVNTLSCLQASNLHNHANSSMHKLAVRSYMAPTAPLVTLLPSEEDDQLLSGAVPQPEDWLLAWVQTQSSFRQAAEAVTASRWLASARRPEVKAKAMQNMHQTMAEAIRARHRLHLGASSSISLMLDDKLHWRLIRFKCSCRQDDGQAPFSTKVAKAFIRCSCLLELVAIACVRGVHAPWRSLGREHGIRGAGHRATAGRLWGASLQECKALPGKVLR